MSPSHRAQLSRGVVLGPELGLLADDDGNGRHVELDAGFSVRF